MTGVDVTLFKIRRKGQKGIIIVIAAIINFVNIMHPIGIGWCQTFLVLVPLKFVFSSRLRSELYFNDLKSCPVIVSTFFFHVVKFFVTHKSQL